MHGLYEIPITLPWPTPRKHMRGVAPHGIDTVRRGLQPRSPQSAFPGNAQQPRNEAREGAFMLDIVMLALGLGFFVAAVGYTYACERL
jgi:hypothetical protein